MYGGAIFGLITRIVKDKMIAEEVLQQTMLKAWNSIGFYDKNKGSLYTWLSTIGRNTAIDKVRLKNYQNQQKTDLFDPLVHDKGRQSESSSKLDVAELTKNLDDKYKLILDKIYLEGFSQSEVSKELDIPLGTVKTRLRQALLILRNELKDEKHLFLGFLFSLLLLLFLLWQ